MLHKSSYSNRSSLRFASFEDGLKTAAKCELKSSSVSSKGWKHWHERLGCLGRDGPAAHRSPRCGMAAKQCAKCDTEQHPALFGQPRGWRAVIKDDTLCDMCRDDKEWRTSFSCMSLSEQLVFAALIGDLYRVESLVGRGASLSTAHVTPTAIGDEGGCSLRLTPVAAAVLKSRRTESLQVIEVSSSRFWSWALIATPRLSVTLTAATTALRRVSRAAAYMARRHSSWWRSTTNRYWQNISGDVSFMGAGAVAHQSKSVQRRWVFASHQRRRVRVRCSCGSTRRRADKRSRPQRNGPTTTR